MKTTKVAMRHVQDLGDSIVSVEDSDTGRKDLPAQWTIPIPLRMHGQAGDKAMPDGTDMGSDKRQSAGPLRLTATKSVIRAAQRGNQTDCAVAPVMLGMPKLPMTGRSGDGHIGKRLLRPLRCRIAMSSSHRSLVATSSPCS